VDIIYGIERDANTVEYDIRDRMTTAYGEVRGHLQKNARYNKRYYDIKVRPRDYEQGQWVWYLNLRKPLRKQQKWISQYEGPYLIIRMLSPLTVEIQKDPRVAPKIVHVDKLKPCKDPPLRSRMTPGRIQVRQEHQPRSNVPPAHLPGSRPVRPAHHVDASPKHYQNLKSRVR